MRTSNIVQKSQSSREVGENAIAMSIDEASSVFLMDALGKLYSRPAQAALREYLSNAIDAHKAKGGKLPAIQITLPDSNGRNGSSKLFIRDFGKGMNEDEFSTILSRYGASTKRDSNAMIGGFGLGAKSGFAISDEFFMNSYQEGKGLRVRIFKDVLNQGYIDVIDRFSTKEEDGILVEIPIPNGNLYELSKKSLFTDFPFFMGYGVDTIDVKPAGSEFANQSVHNSNAFTTLEFGGEDIGWLAKKSDGKSTMYALIGKVAYPVDLTKFSALSKQNKTVDTALVDAVNSLNAFRMVKVINIPIGSVDLPSAREEITYSERSIRTIGAIISNYALMMKQHVQKELNSKTTKLQVLNHLTYLEDTGYKGVNELTWKGETVGTAAFKESHAVFVSVQNGSRYGYNNQGAYGASEITIVNGKAVKKYRELHSFSSKVDYKQGLYRITVDSASEIPAVKKLMTEKILLNFLKMKEKDSSSQTLFRALFVITTKDDVLNEWIFNHTALDVSKLIKIVQKEKEEKLAKAKQVAAEKVKQELAREKAQKTKETRAHTMLSNFVVNSGKAQALTRNTVAVVFKDDKTKKFYWSEEEVAKHANVTSDSKTKLIGGNHLFPFKALYTANTFTVITEKSGWQSTNYLIKMRAFLNLFFDEGTKMIVVGKGRNLEEFKAEYPDVESGVLFVKKAIKEQIADGNSEVMIAYNAIGDSRYRNQDEIRNLLQFSKGLKERKSELNAELSSAVERFTTVESSTSEVSSGLDSKYLLEALKGFVTLAVIQKNSYSVETDVSNLKKKYPLLLNSKFTEFNDDVFNDMFAYIKLCENR